MRGFPSRLTTAHDAVEELRLMRKIARPIVTNSTAAIATNCGCQNLDGFLEFELAFTADSDLKRSSSGHISAGSEYFGNCSASFTPNLISSSCARQRAQAITCSLTRRASSGSNSL